MAQQAPGFVFADELECLVQAVEHFRSARRRIVRETDRPTDHLVHHPQVLLPLLHVAIGAEAPDSEVVADLAVPRRLSDDVLEEVLPRHQALRGPPIERFDILGLGLGVGLCGLLLGQLLPVVAAPGEGAQAGADLGDDADPEEAEHRTEGDGRSQSHHHRSRCRRPEAVDLASEVRERRRDLHEHPAEHERHGGDERAVVDQAVEVNGQGTDHGTPREHEGRNKTDARLAPELHRKMRNVSMISQIRTPPSPPS